MAEREIQIDINKYIKGAIPNRFFRTNIGVCKDINVDVITMATTRNIKANSGDFNEK